MTPTSARATGEGMLDAPWWIPPEIRCSHGATIAASAIATRSERTISSQLERSVRVIDLIFREGIDSQAGTTRQIGHLFAEGKERDRVPGAEKPRQRLLQTPGHVAGDHHDRRAARDVTRLSGDQRFD